MIGRFKVIKQQRIGIVILIGLILLVELVIHRDVLLSHKIELEELPIQLKKEVVVSYSQATIIKNFNPNIYTAKDWQGIGFSNKQAEVILNYKKSIGGEFISKEQIKKCYVISEEKYKEIAAFIQLPEGKEKHKEVFFSERNRKESKGNKDLNTASFAEINSIVKNKEIAGRIVNFRKGLGGFVSKDQLKEVYGIDKQMIRDISDLFKIDLNQVSKIDLEQATENELQNHIYLRKYKNKILEAQKIGEYPLRVIPKSDVKYNFILMYIKE